VGALRDAERCGLLRRAAEVLRARADELAGLITLEMGKLGRYRLFRIDYLSCVKYG